MKTSRFDRVKVEPNVFKNLYANMVKSVAFPLEARIEPEAPCNSVGRY